jgi:hypothetical protein
MLNIFFFNPYVSQHNHFINDYKKNLLQKMFEYQPNNIKKNKLISMHLSDKVFEQCLMFFYGNVRFFSAAYARTRIKFFKLFRLLV